LILGSLFLSARTADAAVDGRVLCAPDDPYRILAQEISAETGYGLVDTPRSALDADPTYVIWVAAPTRFGDRDLVDYATRARHRSSSVSLGFITGRTVEQARAFWHRGRDVKGRHFAIANGADPHTGRFSRRLVRLVGDRRTEEPLTLAGLKDALATADYVSHTGHGTPTRLRLDAQTDLQGTEVPALSRLVLTSGSCNSFRFWRPDSFLLALIERGAAAYAGYAYSPNSGYLLGAFDDLPLRHTWPDFPLGHAVQVLNTGCRQGFANFPFFLLAGDPRLSLRHDRPYEIVEDRSHDGNRVFRISGAPPGVIPVRIPGGAQFRFVRVAGTAAAASDDWFYNARLQMADISGDKCLLALHSGGDLTIQLSRNPPWGWRWMSLLASLDSTLIFAMRHSGDLLQAALGAITWLAIAGSMRRQSCGLATSWIPILLGLTLAIGHALFMALRLPHVTISSKPLGFSWLAVIGTFLVASSGAWIYHNSNRPVLRRIGLLLPVLGFLLAAVTLGSFVTVLGGLMTQRIGAPIYNYHLAWPHVLTVVLVFPAWLALVKIWRSAAATPPSR
jgi:hypothetical protein